MHRLSSLAVVVAVAMVAAAPSRAAAPKSTEPAFRALPRNIHYETTLVPARGARAVIVYGRNAPWTKTAAEQVQTLVREWSGVKLELADDRTVTSEDTWLVAEAYRKTPLIVLGNARDNRVLQALGTRFLAESNRTWPGGDRFVIRTVFEPFVADVNYIALEASTPEGLTGSLAKFKQILAGLKADATATIPHTILVGGVKDAWAPVGGNNWGPAKDYYGDLSKSVSEIALQMQGKPFVGWFDGVAAAACMGGFFGEKDPQMSPGPAAARAVAAKVMNDSRSWGGRIHQPGNHYGGTPRIVALRCVMATGVLTPEEFNEAENWLTLSAAHPNEYFYDHIGAGDGRLNSDGGRHFAAAALITVNLLDYVRGHCALDDPTRAEIERRYQGTRKSLAVYANSFRDNGDTTEMGESTLMLLYAQLHQGLIGVVTNGTLRQMADAYAMTTDNLVGPVWGNRGCYAGLDSYISAAPGCLMGSWHGRGLLAAAAWYYDDSQYRWYVKQLGSGAGIWGSVGTGMWMMHYDLAGPVQEPMRYDGVVALPFDPRLYDVIAHPERCAQWRPPGTEARLPGPLETSLDRLAFRDGMDPDDAYLFLAANQQMSPWAPFQNNTIARFSDLGDLWLFHNTMLNTAWGRNGVSISNGKPYVPAVGCTREALANLGEISMVASRESGGGADWTRTILHWRGHYFVVLDRITAQAAGDFNLVCRWRTPQPAALEAEIWNARSARGNRLRLQPAEPLRQNSEYREMDGAARPYVLSQLKSARLLQGQSETFQNLLYVSGPKRPDEFEIRRVSPEYVLVRGRAGDREHLALIGTGGNLPFGPYQTDAAITVLADGKLHLAGLTTLKVKRWRGVAELFSAAKPVNLLLDCATGKGELENLGDSPVQVKLAGGKRIMEIAPGKAAVELPEAVTGAVGPRALARLWRKGGAKSVVAATAAGEERRFTVLAADKPLDRPCRRLRGFALAADPEARFPLAILQDEQYGPDLPGYSKMWGQAKGVTITLDLGKATPLSHVRLVSTMDVRTRGRKLYAPGDLRFSVVLSDDNFQKDIRKVDNPPVTFEETDIYPIHHYDIGRLPTFRVDLNATARAVRILPESANAAKPFISFQEVELYAPEQEADVSVKALAADLDGDGAHELVVGTSAKEVAAYDAGGRQLWSRRVPGEIFTMDCADLDGDGKAEVLVYTLMEQLHGFNGDGFERYVGDIYQAQLRKIGQEQLDAQSAAGGALAMGIWAPEDPKKKEVNLWSEVTFRVKADGKADVFEMDQGWRGSARLLNLYPGEPEVLATVGPSITLWSPRRDKDGNYVRLATKPSAGQMGALLMHGFGWAKAVDVPGYKGVLAANEGGINWCPIESFLPGSKVEGWGFSAAGVPVVAALAEDLTGDGAPEVFLARQDGFVNVLSLADGKPIALLNTGEPILGMAVLRGKNGRPRLAVGTNFGVHLFDGDFKQIDLLSAPMTAFAGPAGRDLDAVFLVDSSGRVRVAKLKEL